MFQRRGKVAVGLVKCFHRVQKLMGSLAGQLGGEIAQFRGVVNIVLEHILQDCHSLGIGCAAFGVEMLVVVIVMMIMIVAVAVVVLVGVSMGMLVVVVAHE